MTRTCPTCGKDFTPTHGKQRYHRDCAPTAKSPEYAEAQKALDRLRAERTHRRPAGYRAPSLAMAGDTPSREAVHRDCLTGAASATVYRGGQAAGGQK